jgi:hypothetical protein
MPSLTVDQRVEKFGKYGLYNNNGELYCKCCGKKVDQSREDSIRAHIVTTQGSSDINSELLWLGPA